MLRTSYVASVFLAAAAIAACGDEGAWGIEDAWDEFGDHDRGRKRHDAGAPCLAILYETNGRCEATPGCLGQDPVDCAAQDGGAPRACGSRGLEPCELGTFCYFPPEAACGETDRPGTCQTPPDACTREYRPVCGCDGRTYSNPCTAAAATVSVRAEGSCETSDGGTGEICGGYAGLRCDVSEFCDFPPETNCGFGDRTGTCKPLPSCTPEDDAVCGCDGLTYEGACHANAAGVSVRSEGPCGP